MKFGIIPINVGGKGVKRLGELAVAAEQAGLESVWTCEHVIVPESYDSKYPYHPSGKMPTGPETHFVDPLVALSYVAGQTKTIRLGTGINILPQVNPLLFAKQVASLDFLSGGRVTLGLGVGWLEEEFAAMGTPFERRGARFNDYLQAIRTVWTGETVEHEGEFLKWSGFRSYPLPAAKEKLPIVIGGTSDAAYRRVARLADGWISPPVDADTLRTQVSRLRQVAETSGRDPSTIEITGMHPAEGFSAERAHEYKALGVSRLLVPLYALKGDTPVDAIAKLGEAVQGLGSS